MTQTIGGYAPPILFAPTLDAGSANVRATVFSGRFMKRYHITGVAITFEDNTNDSVRTRLWLCQSDTTRTVVASSESSAGTAPTGGTNFFASQLGGSAIEYITGDGPDPIYVPIGLNVEPGFRLALDNDNRDTPNVHTVRARVDMREI